jgi:hypothetical protein
LKNTYTEKFLLTSILLFMSYCLPKENMIQIEEKAASLTDKAQSMVPSTPELTGWGPNPEKIKAGTFDISDISQDWFYKKFQSKAVARSIEVKSNSFMESTCKKSALNDNKENIIIAAISSVDPSKVSLSNSFEQDKKNIEIFKCVGTGLTYTFSDCECVIFFKYPGGKSELQKKLSAQ